jgi:hypothetical protein
VKTRLAETAFDGRDAQRLGGRWNSPELQVIYASEHLSLAALEVLVHAQDSAALRGYAAIAIEFDPRLAIDVSPDSRRLLAQVAGATSAGRSAMIDSLAPLGDLRVPTVVPVRYSLLNPRIPNCAITSRNRRHSNWTPCGAGRVEQPTS